MKPKIQNLFILFACLANGLSAQTYCLTYKVARVENALEVTFGLIAHNTPFKLGSSNLQFKYKSSVVGSPVLMRNALAATSKYNGISLTTPTPFRFAGTGDSLVSLNFNFIGSVGTGLPITLTGTDIAVLRFQIKNGLSPLFRPYDHGTSGTVVYNDDSNQPILLQTTGQCPIYDVLLPTESLPESNRLKVYPNPANDFLNLETIDNQDFRIINGIGQMVRKGKTQSHTAIVLSDLPTGIYRVQVGHESIPFVKQ
jgi:hypothetical protein